MNIDEKAKELLQLYREGHADDVSTELAKLPPWVAAAVALRTFQRIRETMDSDSPGAVYANGFVGAMQYRAEGIKGFELEVLGVPLYVVDEFGIISRAHETAESDTDPGTYVVKVGQPVMQGRQYTGIGRTVATWLPFDACK